MSFQLKMPGEGLYAGTAFLAQCFQPVTEMHYRTLN